METKLSAVNLVGWCGAITILSAYALSSSGILSTHHLLFQFLNLSGALGLLAIALHRRVHQLTFINAIWAIIAIISIINIIRP